MIDAFFGVATEHWDYVTMIFYEFLALLGFVCFYCGRRQQNGNVKYQRCPLVTPAYVIWIFSWTFFAVFRYVGNGIGGQDALSYIYFFEHCNDSVYTGWMLHAGDDLFFKYFNKVIRFVTSDYHIYFCIIYGFMTSVMIYFIDHFCPKDKYTAIPAILIFHIYLRGFNTIRSNFSFCLLLVAIILLSKKKYRWMIGFALASILTHKSMIIFAMFIPFYFIFTKIFKFNIVRALVLLGISIGFAKIVQSFAVDFLRDADFEGSYSSYVNKNVDASFMDNYWKIAFEQMILGMMLLFFHSSYKRYLSNVDSETQKRVQLLWMLCIFDIFLIPMCCFLGIWRGAEYLHMARTVMWCIIFWIFFNKYKLRIVGELVGTLLLLAWIYNRVAHTWEESGLMPYIFDPLFKI